MDMESPRIRKKLSVSSQRRKSLRKKGAMNLLDFYYSLDLKIKTFLVYFKHNFQLILSFLV